MRKNLKQLCLLTLLLCTVMATKNAKAQTTLAAGDVVVIGWNATDNSLNTPGNAYTDDDVCLLLLRDISAGTVFYITDLGWTGTTFMSNEYASCASGQGGVTDGCIKWEAGTGLTAGTQIRIGVHFGLTASSGTVTNVLRSSGSSGGPGNATLPQMSLSTGTDQIYVFQSSSSSTPLSGTLTLIAGVQYGGAYTGSVTSCGSTASQSADPGSNVGGYGFLYTATTARNSYYQGTVTSGSASDLRTAILNTTNWGSSSISQSAFPTATTYNVGYSWQGTTSNWFTTSNWSCTCTPSSTDNVIIPAGASAYPNISTGTGAVKNVTIASGASVSVTGSGVLQIAGSISNSGTFTASSGGITMNGSSAQTIAGTTFNNGTIEDLVISNTAGVSISSALNIAATGSLTVGSGSTLTTGGNLTLLSTASGTARVANSSGTVSGNVTVQRYIPGGRRAFRFLSNPLTTTQPLSVLTDDIDITGTGGSLNGFTTTTLNSPSAFWYDQSVGNGSTSADPGWTAYTSTNGAGVNGWQKGKGLRVLIRGAIGQGLWGESYTPSAVTIDVTGTINQGSQVINITKGSGNVYYFTGNPFPSQIDMSLLTRGGGIGSSYWTWDPNQATKGAYVNRSYLSSYSMPAMAGFITSVSSSTTITFSESSKTANTPGAIFKTTAPTDHILLKLTDDKDSIAWDQAELYFDNTGSTADSEYYDGNKMTNPEVNFYTFSKDSKRLSIDSRPYDTKEAIAMGITNAPAGNYTLHAAEYNVQAGIDIYLHDSYLNKQELMTPGYTYNFSITADSLSYGDGRFELNMQENTTGIRNADATQLHMQLVPNPATDVLTLHYEGAGNNAISISIASMMGVKVAAMQQQATDNGSITIPVKQLPAGTYMATISNGSETTTQQFIKQ